MAKVDVAQLIAHVESAWAPWFSGGHGVIKALLPRSNTLGGQFKGTADAVYQYLDLVHAHAPDLVAVFAADHVYRMDVRQMVDFHLASGAQASVAAVKVPLAEASSFGIISTARDGRIMRFDEKPAHPSPIPGDPGHAYASMGNYLFEPAALERVLREGRSRGETDFGRHILPRMAATSSVYAYDLRTKKWRRLPDLPSPRHGLGVVAYKGRVFTLGGGPQPGLTVSGAVESLRIG